MKTVSKRGAALAIVIVVSAAILILSAALVSAAVYNVSSSQNSLEGRQAYLEAKSAIEYGKAYVKKNPGCGDFTIKTDSSTNSGFGIDTGDTSLADYSSTDRTIHAHVKYQSSDRYRKLKYTFPALAGGAPAYIDAGKRHGGIQIFNDPCNLSNTTVNSPVVAKSTVKLSGSQTIGFTADQMYFMGSGKCLEVKAFDDAATLKADFIYFNADICAVNGYNRLEITPKNNKNGIAYFNSVQLKQGTNNIIKKRDGSDFELNGYYLFSGTLNLFDDYESLTKLTEEEVIDELNGEKFTGEKLTASKRFVEQNYEKMLSGDQDGAKWTGEGRLSNGTPSEQAGCVYLYVIECNDWGNVLKGVPYKADEIHVQYVNDGKNFVFPEGKTVTFMADVISMNTQEADDKVDDGHKPEIEGTGGAHCILKSQSGQNDFDVTFHYKTTVSYTKDGNDVSYDIEPGTYRIPKSKEIDLFSADGENCFTKEPTAPIGGSGGTGSSGDSTGGYSDE